MKIDLCFAHLHSPLFLGKVNWGDKLYTHQAKGSLKLVYDRPEKELLVGFGSTIQIIPTSNVISMEPAQCQQIREFEKEIRQTMDSMVAPVITVPTKAKPGPKPKLSAQAATPHDHVFAPGPGKTND